MDRSEIIQMKGHTKYYSCHEDQHTFRTGFVIGGKIKLLNSNILIITYVSEE